MNLELPAGRTYEYAEIVRFIREYADDGIVIEGLEIFPAQAEHMNEWPWVGMGFKDGDPPQEVTFLGTIFGKHELKIIYDKSRGVEPNAEQPGNTDRVQPEKTNPPGAGQRPGKRVKRTRPADRQSLPGSHKKGKARRASKRPAGSRGPSRPNPKRPATAR